METKRIPAEQGNKLIAFHWELNCNDYRNQVSFTWRYISVGIEILSFCHPPGKDKQVHFNFVVNQKQYHYKWVYNCYGGSHKGELPEIRDDYYKLAIHASPQYLEIREVQTRKYRRPGTTSDQEQTGFMDEWYESLEEKNKTSWFAITNELKIIPRDKPVKDRLYNFWIRKSLHHLFPGNALYKYQLYSYNLIPAIPQRRNFTMVSIMDAIQSGHHRQFITMTCEISDQDNICRTFSLGNEGICDIMKGFNLLTSLELYKDWKDFDEMQEAFQNKKIQPGKINANLSEELKKLGIRKSK
jgi:hypothetical protein